jgi:GDP-4-dehydro-6-deoxy-D-mannose reductase
LSVGSSEIYGHVDEKDMPVTEAQPLAPLNPYAVSKAAQDLLAGQWAVSPGLDILRVRSFNHTGPGQGDNFVCSAFARQAAEISLGLRPPRVEVGNLNVRRDFLDVRDVCRAYLALIEKGEKGAFYNLASGKAQSIKKILNDLLALTKKDVEIVIDPERMRPVDQPVMKGDPSLLRKTTGWRQEIPFKQTLEDLFKWWRLQLKK